MPYPSTPEHFAWIGWKNHKHSGHNPYARFQREQFGQPIGTCQALRHRIADLATEVAKPVGRGGSAG